MVFNDRVKKVFIRTFGCQMNVRDSEVIAGLLRNRNYELANNPSDADIIIFNTCSVRKHAEDKVWSELGRYKKFTVDSSKFIDKKLLTTNYKLRTKPIIGLVGCMAKAYKEKIFEKASWVDFVVGPSDIHKIPEIIENIISHRTPVAARFPFDLKIWETDGSVRPEEIYHTGFYQDKEHVYIVISEGCSNFCSYCIVPFVRGPLRNRNYKDILKEIKEAADKGISKITLLGQNVNAYQYEDVDFIKLLEQVDAILGIKEFSFITSHPKDTSLDLFKAMADLAKLKRYLHLPVQSGSDRILNLMHRGYTRNYYLELVEEYRRIVKNGILSTDIMVGFPTETEEDFQDTFDLMKKSAFDFAYIFKYSVRPYTPAQKLQDDVSLKEKERRHRLLLDYQKAVFKNKSHIHGKIS